MARPPLSPVPNPEADADFYWETVSDDEEKKRGRPSKWAEAKNQPYSPDNFYVGSRDEKGFRESQRVMMPPELRDFVHQLSAKLPEHYGSPNAFIRDAIYHRVHYLNEQFPELRLQWYLDDEAAEARYTQFQFYMQRQAAIVETFKATVSQAIRNKDQDTLRQVIEVEEDRLSRLADPYKTNGLEELRQAKRHLEKEEG